MIEVGKYYIQFNIKNVYAVFQFCPSWVQGIYSLYDNGGRKRGECFDITLNTWKLSMYFTVYDMKHFAKIAGLIPDRHAEDCF